MRFYHLHTDESGRTRGYSHGIGFAFIEALAAILIIAMIIGLPLFIHGPVGWLLEAPWLLLVFLTILAIQSARHPRGARRAGDNQPYRAAHAPYRPGQAPGAMGLQDLEADERFRRAS